MEMLEGHLAHYGWTTSTLIHDEVVIRRLSDSTTNQSKTDALLRDTKVAIRRFEEARGWAPGTLDINITVY